MKLVLAVTAGILIAALIGWWVADPDGFRHKLWGYSQEETNKSWQDVHNTQDRVLRQLEAETLESTIHIVEMRYGEAAASKYRLCHTYPPKTKQHQLECKRLDDRVARNAARDTKHPW